MSWYREIKTLLTFSILILSFIIWSALIHMFGKVGINHKMFLITAVGCFIMQVIYHKSKNKYKKIISCIIPVGLSIPLYFLYHTIFDAVAYSLYNIIAIVYINSIEENDVDYNEYKEMSIKALILFVVISFSTIIVDKQFAAELFRYYVFLIVMTVMLLKESRNFRFKLKNKYSKYFNLSFTTIILLLCFNKVEVGIMFILEKLLSIVLWILKYPFIFLSNVFAKICKNADLDSTYQGLKILDKTKGKGKDFIKEASKFKQNDAYYFLFQVLKIIVFVIMLKLLFIILKLVFKYISSGINKKEDTEEIREKIKRTKENQKDGGFKKLLKKLFKGNLSINMRIFQVFKEFQFKTYKKEIFKTNMTASQLKEVTKTYVDKTEELDKMAAIYNEAKFSDHKMNEEQYEEIKENYNEIKSQL